MVAFQLVHGCCLAGLVNPAHLKRNSSASPGDVLILTKPLGVGVMTTALKKGLLPQEGYEEVGVGWQQVEAMKV